MRQEDPNYYGRESHEVVTILVEYQVYENEVEELVGKVSAIEGYEGHTQAGFEKEPEPEPENDGISECYSCGRTIGRLGCPYCLP